MKQLTQEEFENLITEMVEGKKKIKDAITEMETDHRTFHRRVTDLSMQNPSLYRQYAITFPYRPKQLTHVDYEALLIYVMKNDKTLAQAQIEFDVHERTLRRNIKSAEIAPEIIELYRVYAHSKRGPSKLPPEIEERIDDLTERDVIIDEIEGQRKRTLTMVKDKLEQADGVSFAQKAKDMGTTYRGNRHRLDELRRIVRQREANEKEKEGR